MKRRFLNSWRRSSIGIKFIAVTLPVLAIVVIIAGTHSINKEHHYLSEHINDIGNSISQATVSFSVEPLLLRDYPVLQTYAINLLETNKNIASIKIIRQDGVAVLEQSNIETQSHNKHVFEEDIQVMADATTKLGKVIVEISSKTFDDILRQRVFDGVIVIAVLFFVYSILVFILLKFLVTTPLRQLNKLSIALGSGNLDTPVTLKQEDELGLLAQSLDSMRLNLNSSYTKIQKQNIELKNLDQMKDQFLANMSHELRTPLNAIIGYCELIIEEIQSRNYNNTENDLKNINSSGQHLLDMVNDILDLSKLASGTNNLSIAHYSLSAVIFEIKTYFSPQLGNNTLEIEFNHNEDSIFTDPVRLKQIIINLVSNSIKFTDAGNITVETNQKLVDGQTWNSISVSDTGDGIDKEYKKDIFTPFYQIDSSYTKKHKGTGLGLAICQRLTTLLGGTIDVASEKGKGTVFTICIPAVLNNDIKRTSSEINSYSKKAANS